MLPQRRLQDSSSEGPGADLAFFQGGGGFDPTTMRSIVHEPRSGEPFFCAILMSEPRSGEPIFFAILNPRSDVFLASTNAMETIKSSP